MSVSPHKEYLMDNTPDTPTTDDLDQFGEADAVGMPQGGGLMQRRTAGN
jgi:hypothetical protein